MKKLFLIIIFLSISTAYGKELVVNNELKGSLKIVENTGSDSKNADLMYYNNSFVGKKTANGNIFSQSYFSVAKCGIPLNTFIQAISGQKSLLVKVNDRPNCTRFPILADLSTISFDFLNKKYGGTKKGEFIALNKTASEYYKMYIPKDFFIKSNVEVSSNIPNFYRPISNPTSFTKI